jgi:hypothetical protein
MQGCYANIGALDSYPSARTTMYQTQSIACSRWYNNMTPPFFSMQQSDISINDIVKYWKQAEKSLKNLQKEARELRYRSYEELLGEYEYNIHNPESARRVKKVKSTLHTEKCRAMY